jgi:muramidase (phage lysozyme)
MIANRKAFLSTIAWSEGTDNGRQPTANRGYDVLVGGGQFTDYADHPRQVVMLSRQLASTAAGRYQLLARYWDVYKRQLNLSDFGPDSQDAVALQQIKECKALPDIDAGHIAVAITKCAHIWASLPGAGYNQHENKMSDLLSKFINAGGTLANS